MNFLSRYALYFAWIVSIIATGGSLYMSEILGWIPCDLCWYQRILMYPLVVLLGIATFRDDREVGKYVCSLAGIGMLISSYHILVQQVPSIGGMLKCKVGIPCSQDYLNWLDGFITIPVLAFIGFFLILIFTWFSRKEAE
ncbi:disulfide bond formation protein DsbB [Croceifilum oryzae]|uniref:Disulfide bond formation protein DsbB n=1 Tax=Croceifilum oryzae TaxID=1553429 RepID=A0AAJ1WS92_9BACL|nr:disulfide oxidoreductase [Croceifilum oryzae]MDQ0416788.1 disulfide bond formation protein DsbB [Croceifilum oryzae]